MSGVYFIDGPPGTGKTRRLSIAARRAAAERGADAVAIASLTRAAAAEIAGRDTGIPADAVGTLHAHCYHAFGRPPLAEDSDGIKAWNEQHPAQAIARSARQLEDVVDAGGADEGGAGDDIHHQVTTLRAGIVPRERWTLEQRSHDADWTRFKAETGRMDFTDLIERSIDDGGPNERRPSVLLLDEVQDFSRLELALVRQWARHAETTIMVGDPLQCQPGDAMIATADGPMRFDQLDPAQHRILSFDRRGAVILGKRRPFEYRKTSRNYSGPLLTVTARGRRAECTPNHRWPIRWKLNLPALNVVYLMHRNGRWRIGWCQLFARQTGSLHLAARANMERADETWVLSVHPTKREASIAESIAAAEFGLPLVMFESKTITGRGHYDQAALDTIFDALDPEDQERRARLCLRQHGRDPLFPLLSRKAQYAKNGKRHMPFVHAANLIPEAMTIAADRDGRSVDWVDFTVTSRPWFGTVYSLDVQPHHTYISDGLVTGNCIYSWRGADPHALEAADYAGREVLEQSYRVPAAVHGAAVRWVSQLAAPPAYRPTGVAGSVETSTVPLRAGDDVAALVERKLAETDGTVMVLASCGYMLAPLIGALRRAGIPYHNPYRAKDGAWNPLRGAGRLKAYLRASEKVWGDAARCWTWNDLRMWAEPLQAKGSLVRGAKALIDAKCAVDQFGETRRDQEAPLDTVLELLGAEDMRHPALRMDAGWWYEHLRHKERSRAEYAITVLRKQGPEALGGEPRVIVGTGHSVKGGEGGHVILAPDLSVRGYWHGWQTGGEGRDAIVRLFYVELTRARGGVTLLAPSGAEHVHSELSGALAEDGDGS